MNFSFVILHYKIKDFTEKCVESIINNIKYLNYNIIIVDNGSKNNTGQILKEKYKYINNIQVIILEKNLGFSKGNNVGFLYAKERLNSDFIIMINSDTVIEQSNFINKIIDRYKKENFDIMGPDIIRVSDNMHQNPQRTDLISRKELKKMVYKLNLRIILNKIRMEKYINKVEEKLSANKSFDIKNDYSVEQNNVQLHGACLIFSPNYIKKYRGLFDKTFLYMEEDILYYISKKENLKILYYPKVKILHCEDSSIHNLIKKDSDRMLFKYKNILKSVKVFLKIIDDNTIYLENILDRKGY